MKQRWFSGGAAAKPYKKRGPLEPVAYLNIWGTHGLNISLHTIGFHLAHWDGRAGVWALEGEWHGFFERGKGGKGEIQRIYTVVIHTVNMIVGRKEADSSSSYLFFPPLLTSLVTAQSCILWRTWARGVADAWGTLCDCAQMLPCVISPFFKHVYTCINLSLWFLCFYVYFCLHLCVGVYTE